MKSVEERVGPEVANEVEGRITEILTERGVSRDGVISMDDVKALISQLGSPEEFSGGD